MKLFSKTAHTWDSEEEIAAHTRPISRCSSCGYVTCLCGGCGPHCTPCTCTPIDPKPWEADCPATPNPTFIRKRK